MARSSLRFSSPPASARMAGAGLLLGLLLGAWPVSAEELPGPPVRLELVLGFGGVIRSGSWGPLIVTAENPGRSLAGRLEVDVPDGVRYQGEFAVATHAREVELPAGSRKRYLFVLPFQDFTFPLTVRLAAQGREMARREIDLRPHLTNSRLVVGLARSLSLDALARLAGEGERLQVVYPHGELLPDRWKGYDGVDLVVIHDTLLAGIDRPRVEALERWVDRGGRVVITGGPHFLGRDNALLRGLLPVEPRGLRELDADSLAAAPGGFLADTASFGAPGTPGAPVATTPAGGPAGGTSGRPAVVLDSRVISGRVLLSAGEVPLLVEDRRGEGRVFFLAFDDALPPFNGWAGRGPLWRALLGPPRSGRDEAVEDESAVAGSLIPGLAFPGRGALLAVLLGYLGAALLLIARKRWPAAVGVAVLFSLAGYVLFNRVLYRDELVFYQLSRLEVPWQGRYARVHTETGLVSFRDRRYTLFISGPVDSVRRVAGGARLSAAHDFQVLEAEDRGSLSFLLGAPRLREEPHSGTEPRAAGVLRFRAFRLDSLIEAPLEGRLVPSGAFSRLEMTNRSERLLLDAALVRGGRVRWLGGLLPGETATVDIGADASSSARDKQAGGTEAGGADAAGAETGGADGGGPWLAPGAEPADLVADLVEAYRRRSASSGPMEARARLLAAGLAEAAGAPLLVAWLPEPPLEVIPDGRFLHSIRATLLVMRLPEEEAR